MIRERCLLWAIIVALGALILAQIVGNGMMNHRKSQGDKDSHPNPMFEKLGGKR